MHIKLNAYTMQPMKVKGGKEGPIAIKGEDNRLEVEHTALPPSVKELSLYSACHDSSSLQSILVPTLYIQYTRACKLS